MGRGELRRGCSSARARDLPRLEVAAVRSVPPVHPRPRVTLTASDGTGLRLIDLTARAVVDEPLALTELRLAFENPEEGTVEGKQGLGTAKASGLRRRQVPPWERPRGYHRDPAA